MFGSFKGPANVRDKQPVFESFGERQFTNYDETKHAPAPVWNVHSQSYNNVRIYPGDQLNIKLQTLTGHNQTAIPEQRTNAHNNSVQCPYPNNNQTVVRPTAVINCHSNGTSCCGHPNRVPHHWNTVPPNVPPPRHFVDNISLYNNHSSLNTEDYRFRTDTYYSPINKQALSHRDNTVVNQPSYYSGPLRNVPGVAPAYDVKLPTPLPISNRALGKYAASKVPRTEPCPKCNGNCSDNCELYGGQDIVEYSNADTPNEYIRENMACYVGMHAEPAGSATQYCTQWATNTNSQTEYCRQNNNAAMWVHNSHSAISGNNLASNCWIDKKDLLSGNCVSQYTSHHPGATQQNSRLKDTQDSVKLTEMRVNDVSCMQAPQLINGYPEVLHQEKEKNYSGNFCNHVPGRRIDEIQNKTNGPYFKEKEAMNSQIVPQFAHLKQTKQHDFSLTGAPSMPQERLIFQESQTFASSIGSHPLSVPSFAPPNVLHPYHKSTTKSCFQNTVSGQLHAQDVTANSFSLCKVTEAFTTGIAQPPSRFSSHLTYTQSRISKASNEFTYFQDYESSAHLASNSGTANPAISSVANSLSPKMNPVSTSTCVSDSQTTFSNNGDSKIVSDTLHPAARNEHNFNRNGEYNISDLQSCKRLQESNITGKLMQVIDTSSSNVNVGIRECTDISSNDASNILLKNISSYSSEYNIYSGNIPSGSGAVPFNSSTANVDFPSTQMLTNFDSYSKQFGSGQILNAGSGPDVLSSSGPVISPVGESEVAGSSKVIQSEFSTEKFYEATANPQMKRNISQVGDMKSDYRTAHSLKPKCQKMGQLDVRQFLATWDEETEDVASPRLPDVVLSSNGTPLYVVECGGGNLSEISQVTANSANEGEVQRSGVIVYEHIQPISTGENVTEHTHTDHLSNSNADRLQVNVTDDSGALQTNDCVLLGSSTSETVPPNQDTFESDVKVKEQIDRNIPLSDGQTNNKGNSLCLIESKSPVDNAEIRLQNADSMNTAARETLCPTIYSKELISDPKGVLPKEKTNISTAILEKNNEKESCNIVQGTSGNFLQKTNPVSPGMNYDAKSVSCGPLYEHLKEGDKVKQDESCLLSESPYGTKHSSDEVMTSSRNNNLDDIAVDAFEELTNGKRDKSALKCRYHFSGGSIGSNVPDEYSSVSSNEKNLCGRVYYYTPHQCKSKLDATQATESKSDAQRSGLCVTNISAFNMEPDKNSNRPIDKCALAQNGETEDCDEQNKKKSVLEIRNKTLYPLNYRTLQSTMEMKNKGIVQCYDGVPACQSDNKFNISTCHLPTTMQSDSNIHVKSRAECDYETVTSRYKREVNHSGMSLFVNEKHEILERHLSGHNLFTALEIPEGIRKLPPNCTPNERRSLLMFSNKYTVKNCMRRSSDIPIGNALSDPSRMGVAHFPCNGINNISATTATMRKVISVSCKCLFPNQSVSERIFARAGKKTFLLPIDLLLDRATMCIIRRKLFSNKHMKKHDHCIKGTLDSSKNRFLTNDKALVRKDLCHTQLWNERAHGSGQMEARFSFTSHSARRSPAEKFQSEHRFVTTVFGDSDEIRLSLFLKQHSQDCNQGNYNRIVEVLKMLIQQSDKGRVSPRRQCLRPAVSLGSEEVQQQLGINNISGHDNVPDIAHLLMSFINSISFRDECIQGQSGILQALESTSILFEISESCVGLWLRHLDYNYSHMHKNMAAVKFQDALQLEEPNVYTCGEKNASKFQATNFSLLKNIQTVATTCTASTTRSKISPIQDQICSLQEINCVDNKMVDSNNSVNGNGKLTILFSIKNNIFGGNYQQILSKYLSKSLHHNKIDTKVNSTVIKKFSRDSAKQEDNHNNAKPVNQEGSPVANRQVISGLTLWNQDLLPLKSRFREIVADFQAPTAFIHCKVEEETFLSNNKGTSNGASNSEKGEKCFLMATTTSRSSVKDAISGVVGSVLPYNKNIISEKCPVLVHHDFDICHDRYSAGTLNSRLELNEMCSGSEQQVSEISAQNMNQIGSKTQNFTLELADESEVIISSTSTLEEATSGVVDCNLNDRGESLFLFEDELPCVESYVDADDVTVVSGTHDDILDEDNDIDVPCVVVYPESHENVLHSEENVVTQISSVGGCSKSDAIKTAIISDDVCMNSNCVVISEDESPRHSPQNLLMDVVPCSTQEDREEFRSFSTVCTDEYQNSTVSSTTHINELGDSNRLNTMTTVLLREDRENQNITTSDMQGDFSFFGEEVDYYNTGVLQADSVSDWPYLEEEVISEFQNSDVEPDVPLGNITCERNSDRSQSLSYSPTPVNNPSMTNSLQYQNQNMEASSNSTIRNSTEENYVLPSNEIIDLKCRLSWDKIFDLPRKDKCGYKMKSRMRNTVTKSWPYYCKTQSRWKWPKSKDKLYRKISKKLKEVCILSEAKKQKYDFMSQRFEKDSEKSGTIPFEKAETTMSRSLPNSSSLQNNMWHVSNGNNSNPCGGYKREKNNNYVVEPEDKNLKSDILSNPIVLVQRLILKRNRDCTGHGGKNRVDKNDATGNSGDICNIENKASCSNSHKQGICKSETLGSKSNTDVWRQRNEQGFVEIIRKQQNVEDSCGRSISKCQYTNDKTFDLFKADSIGSRKKAKSFSVEVHNVKHSKDIKKPNDKSVKKHSDERLKELPRVIIKRSPDGSTRYKSFLCLSAATEKYWQPVVMLKRDSNIEELAKRIQKFKLSSHVVDRHSQSNFEAHPETEGNAHKVKHKDNMHASGKKNTGNEYERGAIDTSVASQKKIIKRKEKGDLRDFKNSKYSNTKSLSISSYESFHNIIKARNVSNEQGEFGSASVCVSLPPKSGKKYKGMMKHTTQERDKDCRRIYSECENVLSNIELASRRQSFEMFPATELGNIRVSTPCEDNREGKHNYHESSHTSNNEERYSMPCNTSRDKIFKKFQEHQKSEKNSKKRYSEWPDSRSTTKKQCFWDSDYTKSLKVSSRYQQKCPDITVFSNKGSNFSVHPRDKMTTPNARCSLIDQKVSLQNDELDANKSGDCNSGCRDNGKIDCQACGMELKNFSERSSHIRQHPYHCQRCHLAFKSEGDFVNHLSLEHPQTKEQHHCLLCEKSFTTSDKHQMHLQGRLHRYVELTQRRTIHTIFTLLTGRACPGFPPLTDAEMEGLGWFPSEPGTVHFYHQATPLQMAVQGWLNYQRNKSDCGTTEENKRSDIKDHSQ